MERGNRKKTARPDSSRHRATDIVTYSFLQEIERRSQKLKQLLASKSVVLLCVHFVSSHAQLRQLIYKKSTQCRLTSCLVWAFGRCMESEPQADSLDLLNEFKKKKCNCWNRFCITALKRHPKKNLRLVYFSHLKLQLSGLDSISNGGT